MRLHISCAHKVTTVNFQRLWHVYGPHMYVPSPTINVTGGNFSHGGNIWDTRSGSSYCMHKFHWGGVFFHGKETFVTPMVAALAATMRVADLTENCEIYPTCIQLPCRVAGGPRRKFAKVFSSWKTRMIWLPHAEERIVIYLVVSMQY